MFHNNNTKKGFTLIELMVFFIFISLILAAATPLITKRAKNLPSKVRHGMYVCYGNRYEIYNSHRLIDSGDGCSFTPPRKIGLYKIQLVGSGAGGFDYSNVSETDETANTGFRIDGDPRDRGYYGDEKGIRKFSPAQFKYMLKGMPFTIVKEGTDAGDGGDVKKEKMPVIDENIKYRFKNEGECAYENYYNEKYLHFEEPSGEDLTCRRVRYATEQKVAQQVADEVQRLTDRAASPDCRSENGYECHFLVDEISDNYFTLAFDQLAYYLMDTYHISGSMTEVDSYNTIDMKSYGGKGGKGYGLYLRGLIDFVGWSKSGTSMIKNEVRDSQIERYLTSLIGYEGISRGDISNYAHVWGIKSVMGSAPRVWQSGPITKEFREPTDKNVGKQGHDVLSYDTICAYGVCFTNKTLPTGGKGGRFEVFEGNGPYARFSIIRANENSDENELNGTDGSGIAIDSAFKTWFNRQYSDYGMGGSLSSNQIPTLTAETILKVRNYELGNGGKGASTTVAYVPHLDGDCVFNIPQGGAAVSNGSLTPAQLNSMHDALATTLVCNGGSFTMKAEGGTYDIGRTSHFKSGFDYLKDDGTVSDDLPSEYKVVNEGGVSEFRYANVFTKILNPVMIDAGFGKGGNGTEIIDTCTAPRGRYSLNSSVWDDYNRRTVRRNLDYEVNPDKLCTMKENITTHAAKAGNRGVIIISW